MSTPVHLSLAGHEKAAAQMSFDIHAAVVSSGFFTFYEIIPQRLMQLLQPLQPNPVK